MEIASRRLAHSRCFSCLTIFVDDVIPCDDKIINLPSLLFSPPFPPLCVEMGFEWTYSGTLHATAKVKLEVICIQLM